MLARVVRKAVFVKCLLSCCRRVKDLIIDCAEIGSDVLFVKLNAV